MSEPVSVTQLRTLLGQSSAVHRETYTDQSLADFAKALGAPPEAGLPPTYLTRLRQGEFELFARAGLKLEQILHAEQEYTWDSTFVPKVGDVLTSQAKYTEIKDRAGKSGHMAFATVETVVTLPSGAQARARTVIVVRGVVA